MWKKASLLLACLWLPLIANSSIVVKKGIPQCQQQGTILKCDFEFVSDNVVLENIASDGPGMKIMSVSISNANKVVIAKPLCLDTSFYSVRIVHFYTTQACTERVIFLRFVDSFVNELPRQLTRLELTRSEVKKVNCDLGLQRLMVSHSKIGEFSAPWPVSGAYSLKIEHTSVDAFKALNIENRMYFSIINSTFNSMPKESLILGNGVTAMISNSVIHSEDNAVVINTGARLLLKGVEGKLSVTGPLDGRESAYQKSPPGVPQKTLTPPPVPDPDDILSPVEPLAPEVKCEKESPWIWVLPTLLATVEAFTIIALCRRKTSSPIKFSVTPDTENPAVTYDPNVGLAHQQDNYMNFYSGNNTNNPANVRRR